jgi:hypothetical protein
MVNWETYHDSDRQGKTEILGKFFGNSDKEQEEKGKEREKDKGKKEDRVSSAIGLFLFSGYCG